MSQFQVKETQTTDYMTILRLNAAQYGIRGTKESLGLLIINSVLRSMLMKWEILVYDSDDVLISVGGYLGLFIGVSMMDVIPYIFKFIDSILNKTKN